MKKISAEIVADSIDPRGNRITSFLLTYPRFIHGEVMTHRMFSRNSASSRAIPFNKMVKMVEENPFIPIAWQKDHKGMQGSEYIQNEYTNHREDPGDNDLDKCVEEWLYARNGAVLSAKKLNELGATKQLCNRLLEPFMWHTVLVTATEYDNFFELRCPKYVVNWYTPQKNRTKIFRSRKEVISHVEENNLKNGWENCRDWDDIQWLQINNSQAEIHIQALAEAMWDARNESIPNELKPGEWHIPFGDKFDWDEVLKIITGNEEIDKILPIKIATARCARLSYMTFDGEIDYGKDIKLHDHLLESKHMSPMEHCAKCMSQKEYDSFYKGKLCLEEPYLESNPEIVGILDESDHGWCNNFRGFIPYRYLVESF